MNWIYLNLRRNTNGRLQLGDQVVIASLVQG